MKGYIIFLLLLMLGSCTDKGRSGVGNSNDSVRILKDSVKKSLNIIAGLERTRDSLVFENNYWFDDIIAEDLKQKGIAKPDTFVVNDLLNRQELVPEKGILGGTMRFTNVKLLGDRWAIAEMDDGHILGYVLLKYMVLPGKIIRWTIVDYYVD